MTPDPSARRPRAAVRPLVPPLPSCEWPRPSCCYNPRTRPQKPEAVRGPSLQFPSAPCRNARTLQRWMLPWGLPLLEKAPFLSFPKCSCITSVAPQIPSWLVYDIHGQMLSSNFGNLPPTWEVTFPLPMGLHPPCPLALQCLKLCCVRPPLFSRAHSPPSKSPIPRQWSEPRLRVNWAGR